MHRYSNHQSPVSDTCIPGVDIDLLFAFVHLPFRRFSTTRDSIECDVIPTGCYSADFCLSLFDYEHHARFHPFVDPLVDHPSVLSNRCGVAEFPRVQLVSFHAFDSVRFVVSQLLLSK